MAVETTSTARPSFDLKSAQLPVVAVTLRDTDVRALVADLAQRLADDPDFFDNDPVLIDLAHVRDVLGLQQGAGELATVNAVMLDSGTLVIADTYINEAPNATELADIARLAAEEVARFGLPPKVAFLSHSNYGSSTRKSALKMRAARNLFAAANPGIECDGEMHGDSALDPVVRSRTVQDATLSGEANVLICPNLDAANILFNVLKTTAAHGTTIGPMLLGGAAAAHVLTPSSTVRRVVNMTALAAAQAQTRKA